MKIIKNLFLGSVLFFASLVFVQAASITPPTLDITANPGETVSRTVEVINNEGEEKTFYVYKQDFGAKGESGQPNRYSPEESPDTASVGKWIQVSDEPITLSPGDKRKVDFSIAIPENAEPGGHYGVLVFSTQKPGSQKANAAEYGVGTIILVTVRGETNESAELASFGIYNERSIENVFEKEFDVENKSGFFEYLPVGFITRIENKGNVHFRPKGKIEIYNTFGQKLEEVAVSPVFNPQGAQVGEEKVDYIPINAQRGSVLPNSIRAFPVLFEESEKMEILGFDIMPLMRTGMYSVKVGLEMPNETIEIEESFIVFPWRDWLIVIVALALLITLYIVYRRWSKARMRAQLMKEMDKDSEKKDKTKKKD